MVTEQVAKRFVEELQYCRECDKQKRPRCNYVAREVITITRKG
jgi:hypothetical protein